MNGFQILAHIKLNGEGTGGIAEELRTKAEFELGFRDGF